jgi:MarR family transcriptional regulator, organic hydroperoxide resistance regulator
MFDHCLYFNTSALARLVEREWGAAYAPFDLTPPQGFVLRYVLANSGCLASEIADTLGIARPTATRLVDNLCQKDYVERRQGTVDAREWYIYPTDAGKALEGPVNAASAAVSRSLRKKMGTDLFDTTVSDIRAVRTAIE